MTSPIDDVATFGATRVRPLLHVGASAVELVWLDNGVARHALCAIESARSDAVALAARQLVADGPGLRSSIVVCLDDQAFETQQLLLGHLPDREAALVLARRAANSLSTSADEVLFFAQRLSPPFEQETEVADSNWILHARRRKEHTELLLQLRQCDVRVGRVVALRDVLPRVAPANCAGGAVLVTFDGTTISTHLLLSNRLVQLSRLRVAPSSGEKEVNVSIVQEVRQVSAFWSKGSRGAGLETIAVLGLCEMQLEDLATPLSIAGLGAQIHSVGTSVDRHADSVRRAFLFTIARCAEQARDLALPLPPRRSRVALAAAAATAVAGLVGFGHILHWNARVDDRRSTIAALGRHGVDLESERALRTAFVESQRDLEVAYASLAQLPSRGMPLEQLLSRLRTDVTGKVRLQHVSLIPSEQGTAILIEGAIQDRVDDAARELNRMRTSLQGGGWLKSVVVEPSSRVPDGEGAVGLSFTLTGEVLGASR